MAKKYETEARREHVQAGSFGNESVVPGVKRNLNGMASGDVAYFFKLPRGTVIRDGTVFKNATAGAAGSTAKVGFIAAGDGTKGDDDFFKASVALDGGATINRKDNAAPPVYLDDDDYWVVATIGATAPGANDVELTVGAEFEFRGNL